MGLFDKLAAFSKLLEAGQAVANRKAWSDKANFVGLFSALLFALQAVAPLAGIHFDLGSTDATQIAQGVFNLVSIVGVIASQLMHTAANDEAGVRPKGKP